MPPRLFQIPCGMVWPEAPKSRTNPFICFCIFCGLALWVENARVKRRRFWPLLLCNSTIFRRSGLSCSCRLCSHRMVQPTTFARVVDSCYWRFSKRMHDREISIASRSLESSTLLESLAASPKNPLVRSNHGTSKKRLKFSPVSQELNMS